MAVGAMVNDLTDGPTVGAIRRFELALRQMGHFGLKPFWECGDVFDAIFENFKCDCFGLFKLSDWILELFEFGCGHKVSFAR